ncbi:hypothetical protein MJN51_31790, partial [Salmonella enterica subsp. enterica serovar Kentucky]|nr:hypothetical protein [Salmonella enterica subsp. enterica serovar Kentucky]
WPVYALPWILSKYLALGVALTDVINACTHTPAVLLGMAAEIGEWVMLVLFLLAFFLYGYCIKRAWKVARFIKRVKRRLRRQREN